MIDVGSYCCFFGREARALVEDELLLLGAALRFFGFGIGVMNSARRRRSIRFPVGWPDSSSSQCWRGYSYGELRIGRSKNGLDIRCSFRAQPSRPPNCSRRFASFTRSRSGGRSTHVDASIEASTEPPTPKNQSGHRQPGRSVGFQVRAARTARSTVRVRCERIRRWRATQAREASTKWPTSPASCHSADDRAPG